MLRIGQDHRTGTAAGGTSRTSSAHRATCTCTPTASCSCSVGVRRREEQEQFAPNDLDIVRAVGRSRREELGAMVGVDLADTGFPDRGLDIIEPPRRTIEAAPAAEGRCRSRRRPMKYRSASSGAPATSGSHALRCIVEHPDLELVGLWVHSADKAGRTPASWPASTADGRRSPRTTSTRSSRSTPTACRYTATGDLRPARGGRRHVPDPRVGQERRVDLGRVAGLPAARRPRDASSRSKTRATRRQRRASRRASTPASPTTCSRSCSPASASRSTRCASWRSSTTPPTTSPRCCSTRWASASRSTTAAVAHPGRAHRSRGAASCRCSPRASASRSTSIDEVHERRPAPTTSTSASASSRAGTIAGAALRGAGHRATASRAIVVEHVTRLRRRPRARLAAARGRAATGSIVAGNPTLTCDVQMLGDDGDHNTGGLVGTAARAPERDPRGVRGAARSALGPRPAPDRKPHSAPRHRYSDVISGTGSRPPMARVNRFQRKNGAGRPAVLETLLPLSASDEQSRRLVPQERASVKHEPAADPSGAAARSGTHGRTGRDRQRRRTRRPTTLLDDETPPPERPA